MRFGPEDRRLFVLLGLILTATGSGLLWLGSTATASPSTDSVCVVPIDGDYGNTVQITTREYASSYDVPGVGSTSNHAAPCVPTACPPPLTLGSGGCMSTDPLAHVPYAATAVSDDPPSGDYGDRSVSIEVVPECSTTDGRWFATYTVTPSPMLSDLTWWLNQNTARVPADRPITFVRQYRNFEQDLVAQNVTAHWSDGDRVRRTVTVEKPAACTTISIPDTTDAPPPPSSAAPSTTSPASTTGPTSTTTSPPSSTSSTSTTVAVPAEPTTPAPATTSTPDTTVPPPGGPDPTSLPPSAPLPLAPDGPTLPATGAQDTPLPVIAAGVLLLGAVAAVVSRRPRSAS